MRHIPVENEYGGLEGLLAVEDVLELLTEQINGLTALVKIELQHEQMRDSGH